MRAAGAPPTARQDRDRAARHRRGRRHDDAPTTEATPRGRSGARRHGRAAARRRGEDRRAPRRPPAASRSRTRATGQEGGEAGGGQEGRRRAKKAARGQEGARRQEGRPRRRRRPPRRRPPRRSRRRGADAPQPVVAPDADRRAAATRTGAPVAGPAAQDRRPRRHVRRQPTPAAATGAARSRADDLRAVVEGWSHDPHAVLGAHRVDDGWVVRTLRPDAVSVAVVDEDGSRYEARQLHDGGIYEARLPQQPGDYRIEVTYGDGAGGTDTLHRRRPVPLDADGRPARPAPDPRGPARAAVGGARRARPPLRHPARRGRGRLLRRLGAQRPRA